jgi:hypothetical protein
LILTACSIVPLYENDDKESSSSIYVDVISGRDGQMLREFLTDFLRDIKIADKKYRLTITLACKGVAFAMSTAGGCKRLKREFTAKTVLKDHMGKILLDRSIRVFSSHNAASARATVIRSMYNNDETPVLKELSYRIMEQVRVFLINEV